MLTWFSKINMPVKREMLIKIALGLGIVGLVLVLMGSRKSITITVNGRDQNQITWAWTVKQAVTQAGYALSEYDQIWPEPGSLIANGSIILLNQAAVVRIEVDGHPISRTTAILTPLEILQDEGIEVLPGDQLFDGDQPVPMDSQIKTLGLDRTWVLHRAKSFILHDGTHTLHLTSHAPTVGRALWENGIQVQTSDALQPSADTPLTQGLEISLRRSQLVTVNMDQQTIKVFSPAITVGNVLIDAGLSLQGLDYTIPPSGEPVSDNSQIKLVRVREETYTEQSPIPFETSYQPVDDLEIDRQTVIEDGAYGLEAQRYRIRYEDEQEVIRQLEETWVAQAPQNRVIGYGTQIIRRSIDTSDGTVEYWRALEVYATSYNPTSAGGNITSTGQVLKKGIIGVNPRYIPYGTVMYVPGYGYGVAADTGLIGPRWIDLGYEDHDFVGWHQNVTVYFVWPPPDKIVWIIP